MTAAYKYDDVLVEPWLFSFDYKRTTGPVVGRFLGGLGQKRVWGMRLSDGRVCVPPTGYDPATGKALSDWVEVGAQGSLQSWTWIDEPLPTHPSSEPFGWALVKLDGADTSLLHALKADRPQELQRNTRVRIVWRNEPTGTINDILHFEPVS